MGIGLTGAWVSHRQIGGRLERSSGMHAIAVKRRDRLGGLVHEYELAA